MQEVSIAYPTQAQALASQRILAALDEIIAWMILCAERLEQFGTAMPPWAAHEMTELVAITTLALIRYNEGAYETAASLASMTSTDKAVEEAPNQR